MCSNSVELSRASAARLHFDSPTPVPISVYTQEQDFNAVPRPGPEHAATRRLSIQILRSGMARQLDQNGAIQLTTALPWAEVKRMARAHVDPRYLELASLQPIREYPDQLTCMAEAFRRCMRYPVELAKDQRSWPYSFALPA